MAEKTPANTQTGSQQVESKLASVEGWQGDMLRYVRRLIKEAVPDVEEDCKWAKTTNPMGVPVWSSNGIICTGESYKSAVKLTFMNGASLKDPNLLFNASLDGKTRRAIDLNKESKLDETSFKSLILAAAEFNRTTKKSKK